MARFELILFYFKFIFLIQVLSDGVRRDRSALLQHCHDGGGAVDAADARPSIVLFLFILFDLN